MIFYVALGREARFILFKIVVFHVCPFICIVYNGDFFSL